jgi:hypothetical protein
VIADQDYATLETLRKPIDELVAEFFPDASEENKIRLRQLAWQGVDVLAKTGDVGGLENDKNIIRLVNDVKILGASEKFIEKSFDLAISIYRELQIHYPGILKSYQK